MKKTVLLICVLAILLSAFSACSKKPDPLSEINVESIKIYYEYDEQPDAINTEDYYIAVVKSYNTSIKDYCVFSYVEDSPSYEWTIAPDGTKQMHSNTGSGAMNVELDISVFEKVLDLIKKGDPSIYTGPGSDSQGHRIYKTLPFMIILEGRDKAGARKVIYIDSVLNRNKLNETIENMKKHD